MNIDAALSFAEKAVQIAPVYYVTGNHEASLSQYSELKTGLEAAGVIVLEDKAIQLEHNGGIVTLMGLSDPNFTIKSNIFDEVPPERQGKCQNVDKQENQRKGKKGEKIL